MGKLSYKSVISLVPKAQRAQLLVLAALRIMANLLDLVGLAGIALLATAFGSIAAGTSGQTPIDLPLVGEIFITEVEAVFIAAAIAATFIAKSVFSIWLNLKTAIKVAEIEGDFARELTSDFFSNEPAASGSLGETVSKFQSSILVATAGLASFMNARISLVAESSLMVALVTAFLFVNPIATFAILVYLGGVILALNKVINVRLKRNSRRIVEGSQSALSSSRDLFGVRREVQVAGLLDKWLVKIVEGKRQAATGRAVTYTINTLPRYVIETSLILGIFAFLGGVVVFSDLATQSVTIGVFMAGGLRLVASILPVQAAYNTMVGSAAQGKEAYDTLRRMGIRDNPSPSLSLKNLPTNSEASLEFKAVSFSYVDSTTPTIQDVSFSVKPNSKVAIVGPSGAGKTTIFELATGFKRPDSGSALIFGRQAREVLASLPGYLGIVPQRPHLITGTIAENVSLKPHESTDLDMARNCLEKAGLMHFCNSEQALRSPVVPDSGALSGGEIQRLGLARALYPGPRILFLDEATSALDAETENQISSVLDELQAEMTVVLIAHRLSTVISADSIIYVDNGRVVAQGTFSELKKSVPNFARAVELMDLGE